MTKRIIFSLAISALILSSGFVSTAALAQVEGGAPVVEEPAQNPASGEKADHKKGKKGHKKGAHKKAAGEHKKGKKHGKKHKSADSEAPKN